MIDNLPPLRQVIADHGLSAKKSLGQNFLFDLNLTSRIAREAEGRDDDFNNGTVVEIGPGPGGLTRALLANGVNKLVVIEKDRRCIDALNDIKEVYKDKLEIIEGDATKIDVSSLGDKPIRIVANLPYNVSTKLLIDWLHKADNFKSFTLMFQKEVVERLTAKVGTKDYGRLSVITQWLCDVEKLFDVNPASFTPPPKIMSSVAKIKPKEKLDFEASLEILEKVTEAAFGQRRKMLRSSLKKICDVDLILKKANIDECLRAENISVEGFCAIARAIEEG